MRVIFFGNEIPCQRNEKWISNHMISALVVCEDTDHDVEFKESAEGILLIAQLFKAGFEKNKESPGAGAAASFWKRK